MNVLGLFSGIGGFELGFERAGFRIAAMYEIEPYAVAVLRRHWPDVPIFGDIRQLRGSDVGHIDVVTGGFPCQDISLAGKGAGITGSRSGLWFEYERIIGEVRPSWVVIENVSALRSRGLEQVLGSLAALGYDAEWHCVPASAVGAPHRRDRVWIVAYPARLLQGRLRELLQECAGQRTLGARDGSRADLRGHWLTEPNVGRVAHGVPARVDRLKGLGNAVVPQIPELIARAIMAATASTQGQAQAP